jgi:hypothetical protein
VRANLLRVLSLAFAICLAFLALLSTQGITYSTSNSLVKYSLNNLPDGDQFLTINSAQVISSPSGYANIQSYLHTHLGNLIAGDLTQESIYSQLSDTHGIRFYFGASDHLSNQIQMISGRAPASCTAKLCEVVQVGRSAGGVPRPDSFGLKIVGSARFTDPLLFTGTMKPADGNSLLIANGISGSKTLAALTSSHATDAWVGKIDLSEVNSLGASGYIAKVVAFEDQLSIDYPELILTWPQDALSAASDQAGSFKEKTTLIKFAIITLLIGFISIVGFRQRRDHQKFRESLSRIGTPNSVLIQELWLESKFPVVLGALLAVPLSIFLPLKLRSFGFHASFTHLYSGSLSYFLILILLVGLLFTISLVGDRAFRAARYLGSFLAAASAGAYLYFTHVSDTRYLLLPFIYLVAPVVLLYLALKLFLMIWRSRGRQTFVMSKEFFSLWHGVGATIALATLLAMAALSFGSGVSEQAIHSAHDQVPLDVSLKTGSALVKPLDLAGESEYSKLIPGSFAYGVLRTGTSVRGQSTVSDSLAFIGVSPLAVKDLNPSQSKLVDSSAFSGVVNRYQVPLGPTKTVSVVLKGIPPEIDASAWFINPHGAHESAMFSGQGSVRTLDVTKGVTPGSRLIAFEFAESSNYLSRRLHANGEGDYSVLQIKGVGSISAVKFDGVTQTLDSRVWGTKNFSFDFDGQSLYIQPKRAAELPSVIVDPATAALASKRILTLTGAKNTYIQVKVAGVVPYFPSAGDRFVIMSLNQMQNELGQSDLGSIDPIEVWIKTPDPQAYVEKVKSSGFSSLVVQSSSELQAQLRANPNDSGILAAYRVALLYALFVALLITLSALPLIYREGRATLIYLENVGATPGLLRRSLRSSLRIVSLLGLAIGGVLGSMVGRLFISSSVPFKSQAILLLASSMFTEIVGAVITRTLFTEGTLGGGSQ